MRVITPFGARLCAVFLAATLPQVALADDPRDPAMRNRAAREADAAEIRRLNRAQAAYVQQRDAHYAAGWQDYREAQASRYERRANDADERAYREASRDYENAMAEWRRDVQACRSGYYERCAR